jgi:trimethylamine---corrinoid protein Co-methyltransferase
VRGFKNTLRPLPILPPEAEEKVHHASLALMRDTGVVFEEPRALDFFRRAGVRVDDAEERVFLPPEFVEEQIRKAPSQFVIRARNPDNDVVIGGDNLVFAPVSGPPFVTDRDRGRRDGVLEDFLDLIRLSEVTEVMHHGCPEVSLKDLPVETRHLDVLYHQIRLSAKGMIGDAWSAERARDHIDMMAILFGGREAILETPVLTGIINSNSPLRYDSNMAEGLIEYAAAGQVNIITPFIMAGATSPVTLAAAVAQQNAEALAAVVLTQLVRPGAPVMYGSFLTGLEMRTGAPAFGRPESALGILASAQMARRYRLPCRGGGVLTNSKVPDAQAGQEKVMMLWPLLLGGVHYVLHAAGWLDGGLSASFEQFVMDAELLEMTARFFAGVPVDEGTLALDVIAHVGVGGHFLGEEHTRKRFRGEFYFPNLADTEAYEAWAKKGSKDAYARAGERYKKMLATYQQPPLDPATDEALQDFVARRKREIQAAAP